MSLSCSPDVHLIESNYLEVVKYGEEHSGCNKVKIGAGLFSKDDKWDAIYGANGVVEGSCIEKGPDYCSRVRGDDIQKEFNSCPSACAEGTVLLWATFYLPNIDNSYLICTRSPCERCTAYLLFLAEIEYGIDELYFGEYKGNEDEPRLKDIFHIDTLIDAGISVHQIKSVGYGVYDIISVEKSHDSKYYLENGFKPLNPIPFSKINLTNTPISRRLLVNI